MKTLDLTPTELNNHIKTFCPPAEHWQRIDVGDIETYVGDGQCVITLIDYKPTSVKELEKNCRKAEETVTRYLQDEGFIGKNYLYLGLQQFDLTKPPFEL